MEEQAFSCCEKWYWSKWRLFIKIDEEPFSIEINTLGCYHRRYTAACTRFEAIFGKSLIGNSFKAAVLSDHEAEIAQHAAHSAVLKPNEVTEIVEYKVEEAQVF